MLSGTFALRAVSLLVFFGGLAVAGLLDGWPEVVAGVLAVAGLVAYYGIPLVRERPNLPPPRR